AALELDSVHRHRWLPGGDGSQVTWPVAHGASQAEDRDESGPLLCGCRVRNAGRFTQRRRAGRRRWVRVAWCAGRSGSWHSTARQAPCRPWLQRRMSIAALRRMNCATSSAMAGIAAGMPGSARAHAIRRVLAPGACRRVQGCDKPCQAFRRSAVAGARVARTGERLQPQPRRSAPRPRCANTRRANAQIIAPASGPCGSPKGSCPWPPLQAWPRPATSASTTARRPPGAV
ncbi:MAG: hypothetical protein RIQ53_3351, partial [Pseudomonadota bacterium]